MARSKKPPKPRKPTAAKVSRKMASVRPLQGQPGIARRYETGLPSRRPRDPWVDEGEPEVNG